MKSQLVRAFIPLIVALICATQRAATPSVRGEKELEGYCCVPAHCAPTSQCFTSCSPAPGACLGSGFDAGIPGMCVEGRPFHVCNPDAGLTGVGCAAWDCTLVACPGGLRCVQVYNGGGTSYNIQNCSGSICT